MTMYTVIGVYPDELTHHGADEASYVEWVVAPSPDDAVEVARALHEERQSSLVVAVIEGHHIDRLFNKGLASEPCSFRIVRFYRPDTGEAPRTIKTGLTLEEAQAHCSREDTHGETWFDGYMREE